MSSALSLGWLPLDKDWLGKAKLLGADPATFWRDAVGLANSRLDLIRTNRLDQFVRARTSGTPPEGVATKPIRLAILSSSTCAHLHPAIRVAGLRRGLWITTYENNYGQYFQELLDPSSALHQFGPNTVLFSFDAYHLAGGVDPAIDYTMVEVNLAQIIEKLRTCWRIARDSFRCPILQQTTLPMLPPLLGSNEHRLPGSRSSLVTNLNALLRELADREGVDLVALDDRAVRDGVEAWHDPVFWHSGKQEVSPAAAPFYGELIARLLAAQQGRSAKCLVLDLDNTLWGGVVGDDGLEGLVLGQGSALGEAYIAFQDYARGLARRGIILAACSKNDEATALAVFDRHPEMLLRRGDIACFAINWNDKASNIREIARRLNIGLDSLVFVDDNPFERNQVRFELPMVAVPEMPEDPALIPQCLADAGYFEAVAVTEEDFVRTLHYQENRDRATLKAASADLSSYLRGLEMCVSWRYFDGIGLQRIVQLINKTNQFNLTTLRYSEDEVVAVIEDPKAIGLQLRLTDRFGDNGIIAIVIGRLEAKDDLVIDTWLMSCRVLGRQVEEATLNVLAEQARRLGAVRLVGEYCPTAKNGMVREHYARLGFRPIETGPDGSSLSVLDLRGFVQRNTFIAIQEG